jgi:transcription elongation factor Elf1
MNEKGKYPNRSKYLYFKKSDRVRYLKFKATCPNCGKVCVEDILTEIGEKLRRQALVCHRCGHDTSNDHEPLLIWKRTTF